MRTILAGEIMPEHDFTKYLRIWTSTHLSWDKKYGNVSFSWTNVVQYRPIFPAENGELCEFHRDIVGATVQATWVGVPLSLNTEWERLCNECMVRTANELNPETINLWNEN